MQMLTQKYERCWISNFGLHITCPNIAGMCVCIYIYTYLCLKPTILFANIPIVGSSWLVDLRCFMRGFSRREKTAFQHPATRHWKVDTWIRFKKLCVVYIWPGRGCCPGKFVLNVLNAQGQWFMHILMSAEWPNGWMAEWLTRFVSKTLNPKT